MARRIYEFGEKVHQKLQEDNAEKQALRGERSGKISGGKIGKPTLWVVLDMIGVPDEVDPYLLGKFQRGNDVEARAIEFLTNIPVSMQEAIEGTWTPIPDGAVLSGEVNLQQQAGYRGGTGYVDIAQRNTDTLIKHEIKSVTKMAYDKVTGSGRSANTIGQKPAGAFEHDGATGEPYYHHEIQLAYYCYEDNTSLAYLHYLNADDYRLTSFEINPLDYKEHIDELVDSIQLAFADKRLPAFVPFLGWHKAYKRSNYGEWNDLTPEQMMDKLERQFPEQLKKFKEMTV